MKTKIVPPREERMENLGKPKAPKMGDITPTSVELPDIDTLLAKLEKAIPEDKK